MCYGSEFTGQIVDLWAYHYKVRMDFSRPGKPQQNAYVERYNCTVRTDWLNQYLFESIAEAQDAAMRWL